MSNINPRWGAWALPPETMSADVADETIYADIVILGAGIAGVTCALRAAQHGAQVLVLEKSHSWSGRGGNIGVANSSFMLEHGVENNVEDIAREWIKRCGNRCDERILWLFLKNGDRAMDWLADIVTRPEYGARVALQGCIYKGDTYRELIGSHRFFDGPMAKKGMRAGGADAVYAMYNEAVKLGVRFLFDTPAVQLYKEESRIAGAFARDMEGRCILTIAKHGTVLATGDIGGNREMCEDLAPDANKCASKIYTPVGGNTGDGHRMGVWAGGALEDTPFPLIMHPQAFHFGNYCFLFVNQSGVRFMNEDNYVQGKCVAMLRERMSFAWSIIDSKWKEKIPVTLKYGGGLFWGQDCEVGESGFDVEPEQLNLERGIERGVVVSADTPAELAEKMNIPADTFQATFAHYNTMVATGKDEDFGKRAELLLPLDTPPYFGLKFGPALLAVVGGLRVDVNMNVLDEEGNPVSGLYAIGNAAGGRYGVDYPILIAGNSHGTALTFGYILGESLGCGTQSSERND